MPRRLVRDIMKRRPPVVARSEETVQVAAARMTEQACGSVLVYDGDELCGIFTERDLVTRVVGRGLDPSKTRLAEVMTRGPDCIGSTETARSAAADGRVRLPPPAGGRRRPGAGRDLDARRAG